MTDKTKSEVMAELKAAVDLINNGCRGLDSLEITKDHCINQLWIKNRRGVFFGNAHPYTPDPDTREVALEKAKNEAFEQLTNGRHVSPVRLSDGAFVFFSGPERDVSHKHKFVYAPAVKTSTDKITDEAPPKGMAVEGRSGAHYLSLGELDHGCLAVMNREGETSHITLYKSLTTPHRSKDWEETE